MCSKDNKQSKVTHARDMIFVMVTILFNQQKPVYNRYNVPVSMVARSACKMKHKESDGGSFARL